MTGSTTLHGDLYIPVDNESAKHGTRKKGFYGVCGPSTIAVLTHKTVQEIISLWSDGGPSLWSEGYKGYAPMREMEATLHKLGYEIERKKGDKAKEFPEPTTDTAIIRIQWLKPDGTEYYWRAQTPNTHYVLMEKHTGEWWIFCNSALWFKKNSEFSRSYLKLGYVSSYLEIRKTGQEQAFYCLNSAVSAKTDKE
jgi:hypothetical protein